MRRSVDEMIERGETRELGIFVPAIMSAGLVFSLIALVQDGLQRRRWSTQHRRAALNSRALVDDVRRGSPDVREWLRGRGAYVGIALLAGAAGVLFGIGATGNYLREDGYVSDIVWLWAVSLLAAVALLGVASVASAIAWRWPHPPGWTLALLSRTALSRRPPGLAPRGVEARAGIGALWAATMLGLLALVVAALPGAVAGSDVRFADVVAGWSLPSTVVDVAGIGSPEAVLLLAVLALLLGYRCLLFCVAYVGAVAAVYTLGFLLQQAVQRSRPLGVRLTGSTTFPSVPTAQAVLIAGLLPLAIGIVSRRRWPAILATVVLSTAAVAVAVVAVNERTSWPTDVIGGALLGLTLVGAGRWVMGHAAWHGTCRACAWAPEPGTGRPRGLIRLSNEWERGLQRGAIAWTLILAGIFLALAITVGLPQDASGMMLPSIVTGPLQIVLLALMFVGGFLAFRWPAGGAVVIALAGIGLGVLSAAEYPPTAGVVIALAALVPGFALWLAWQHSATARGIWAVALTTTLLLGVTYAGASGVYDRLWGPTHPESPLALRPVDGVQWVWFGDLQPTGAVVVARTDFGADHAHVRLRPVGGGAVVRTRNASVPENRVVRIRATGLEPGTRYAWRVVVDGRPDTERGRGSLTTPVEGAQSLTVVVGSCARTGSNGRVFDAMRREEPDLAILTGDLFYENIEENQVGPFLDAYDRALTQSAPAALLRSTPATYLWDDHDYGPNDADRSSPSRQAARTAYREVVPHARLAPNGPPAQAFTVGRVRFIVTDERSQRTPETMLGTPQMEWFLGELVEASRSHALVVWVNSVPWIGDARPGADGWAGYPDERRRIADAIADADITNLVMLAGDAHMVAIDDGTYTDYATDGGGGFPLLHAAALDRPGAVKGGPYSEGAILGGGQYGVLRITDDGGAVTVELEGKRWDDATLLRYRFTIP